MRKKNNFTRILRKYNFIILFGASFAAYMSVMGVQALCQNKKAESEMTSTIPGADMTTGTSMDGMVSLETESSQEETTEEGNATEGQETEGTTQQSVTQPQPAPQKGSFTTVDASYLDGALFIGDSRTVTLSDYAGWSNTSFFVETGLTIWTVMDAKVANVGGATMSVRSALGAQKYDKIYIMLGINELGKGTPDSFCDEYRSVINEIRGLQPQAVIYIESIMHVTQGKDDENYYINNGEVNARNAKIQTIADGVNIFWIDENEVFDVPGTGKLNPEYTFDGVHLKPMYINIWQEFLLSHVVTR